MAKNTESSANQSDAFAKRAITNYKRFLKDSSKEHNNYIDWSERRNGSIREFSNDLNLNDVIEILKKLKHEDYPHLFIFIIENENTKIKRPKQPKGKNNWRKIKKQVKEIKKVLLQFGKNRPIILQLKSKDENLKKCYFKEETSCQFSQIELEQNHTEVLDSFPAFLLSFLDEKTIDFKDTPTEKLFKIQNLSVVLRLLRISNYPEDYYNELILKCAANGSKSNFLAILDAPFEENGRILNDESQEILMKTIDVDKFQSGSLSDDSSSETSSVISKSHLNPSVLYKSIENSNQEVVDYLIDYCTHLIQQLPFKHQVRISTHAYEKKKIDVLCDLLEFSDFPFPDIDSFENERLEKIIKERRKFENSIKTGDLKGISKFVNNNLSLKIVYDCTNKSALQQAVDAKKYNVYYYLKSLAFKAPEFTSLDKILSGEELKNVRKQAYIERKKNVKNAFSKTQNTIDLMYHRSGIHGRKISKDKEKEAEYYKNIRKWYEDIYNIKHSNIPNIGKELLDVVVQCEELKIIFDFESELDENSSLSSAKQLGSTYPISKWIFVGAKLTDKKRAQQIKGVLAHELFHYAMQLVYENQENPYYQHVFRIKEEFEKVVKEINMWSPEKSENHDDECNGIISSVFRGQYTKENYHRELIARIMEILATFDDNEEKSKYLQRKFKSLFEFLLLYVLPEMQKFNLKNRENVRKMNRVFDLLEDISNRGLKFVKSKDIKNMINNSKITIVTANVPMLLLVNIYNYLSEEHGDLLNAQNIFIDLENLKNKENLNDFLELLKNNPNLNVFVDYSKGSYEEFKKIIINKTSNYIFIVPKHSQNIKLYQNMTKNNINPFSMEIKYEWSDLTIESQNVLFQAEINFQNNSPISFYELFEKKYNPEESTTSYAVQEQNRRNLEDFSAIIDAQLLNLLMEKSNILINTDVQNDPSEENFDILFQPRMFIRKETKKPESVDKCDESFYSSDDNSQLEIFDGECMDEKIPQSELFLQVINKKYVLISDIAGSGKSWTMKKFKNMLREQNPTNWVTHIDLRQFIKIFKSQESEPIFLNFAVENFFNSFSNYEVKIFIKLYKLGKVFILFDGFDEIAPDYAEFVSNLAKSFEFNGGNQLWITTRDYFEVDLKDKLQLDVVYKLDEFTDGRDFIAKSWILNDPDTTNKSSKEEFENYLKNSQQFKQYQKIASKIIKKISTKYHSIGMPQLYKMIADIFKGYMNDALELKEFKIFEKFVEKLYEKSFENDDIRKRIYIKSQRNELTSWKFHQYSAFKKLFPELVEILFPNYNESEWLDEEIIAYGLMNKKGEEFFFLHATFCEFFVADFISAFFNNLTYDDVSSSNFLLRIIYDFFIWGKPSSKSEIIIEHLVKILTNKKFELLQIFLDDAIDIEIWKKLQVQNFIAIFYKMNSLPNFFARDLEKIVNFILTIFRTGNYKKIKNIISLNIRKIIILSKKDSRTFAKFQAFLFEFLNTDDIKSLLKQKKVLHRIIESRMDIEIFENFVEKTKQITSSDFISEILKLLNNERFETNIFYLLCRSPTLSAHKVKKFFEIIQKYITNIEILEMMKNCSKRGQNVLQICAKLNAKDNLKVLWKEFKIVLTLLNSSQNFNEFVRHRDKNNKNIIHCAAYFCCNVEFHTTLWELLLDTIDNKEDLKKLILQKDKWQNNCIHSIVKNNILKYDKMDIIDFTFTILRNKFGDDQFAQILKTKGNCERNLLQIAARESKSLKQHEYLWETFQNLNDFSNIVQSVDEYENNVLHIAASFLPSEIFEFMMKKLESDMPSEIRSMLKNIDINRRNILQSSAKLNLSLKLHKSLWKYFHKHLEPSEILTLIQNVDIEGHNVMHFAIRNNTEKIVELTWEKIKIFLSHKKDQVEYLNKIENILENPLDYWDRQEVFNWTKNILESYNITNQNIHKNKICTVA